MKFKRYKLNDLSIDEVFSKVIEVITDEQLDR